MRATQARAGAESQKTDRCRGQVNAEARASAELSGPQRLDLPAKAEVGDHDPSDLLQLFGRLPREDLGLQIEAVDLFRACRLQEGLQLGAELIGSQRQAEGQGGKPGLSVLRVEVQELQIGAARQASGRARP